MTDIEKAAAARVKRTARQELGDVIRYHRQQRERVRDVASERGGVGGGPNGSHDVAVGRDP